MPEHRIGFRTPSTAIQMLSVAANNKFSVSCLPLGARAHANTGACHGSNGETTRYLCPTAVTSFTASGVDGASRKDA